MTIRIGIAGITGRMGREIAALAAGHPSFVVIGGVSRQAGNGAMAPRDGWKLVPHAAELLADIDVLVDFSAPAATTCHARACLIAGVPLVCGTTGLDAERVDDLHAAAQCVAVFHAANMSPGVNAMLAALPALVRALAGYDLEIVETHHRHKVDAPSGTALALARIAAEASGAPLEERARHGRVGASLRQAEEIGIHAVRGGGNPGEHAVILASDGEEVRLSHRSFSRAAYAHGALKAARLILNQPPGWYEPATLPGFL